MSLDEVSRHEPQVIDLKDRIFSMNGNCPHAVEAFEGTRYSIVLFTISKYPNLSEENVDILKQKGYIWPDVERTRMTMSQYYKPKGYQQMREGKEQICQTLAEMKPFVSEWMLTNKKAIYGPMWKGLKWL